MDLRALDAAANAGRDVAAMRAILARIVVTPQLDAELARLLRFQRAMLATAAMLAAFAFAVAKQLPRGVAKPGVSAVAEWIDAAHVPSNQELLALREGER
jgi:hypothetical protein